MSYAFRYNFGRSCAGLRKTISPKCEDEPGCTWIVSKGCRASGPGTVPPKSEMPIGNCARCAKTVKRRDCPGGVCGANGLCHWCVGEGCKEIGYECKRAAASAAKQAKAHAAREKRAKSAAEKEAARRAKEQAKAQAKQAREDAKRAKEQERRAKEAARKAKRDAKRDEERRKKAEKRRKAEEKRRRNQEQRKKANACKENVQIKKVINENRVLNPFYVGYDSALSKLLQRLPHKPGYGGTFEFPQSGLHGEDSVCVRFYDSWREVWAKFVACDLHVNIGDIVKAYNKFAAAVVETEPYPEQDEEKCDRNEQQRTLEQNPKCQGESIFCDPFNNPDVQYLQELLNTAWGGKNGPMPKKLMPASEALTSWREVHALYLSCVASAEDILREMDKFNLLIDQVRFEIQERADKAKAPKSKAKGEPCVMRDRFVEIEHLDPLSTDIYPALSEMALVWPEQYPSLPKERVSPQMDIRPHANAYMALPSRRKVELFVAWMELANAFDKYVECKGPLSDFRQARRRFTSVEEDYRAHADEEDLGAGGSAGKGGGYSRARAGADCNSEELAKARNYAEAIAAIWNDPKGLSKAKIIKLIRDKGVPAADVKGLTKNQLVEWARQLFGVPGGEVRQEDGTRTAVEHHFAEYDLNDDRYLDESELVWAKCSNGFGYY